jgi:hypothetical protein
MKKKVLFIFSALFFTAVLAGCSASPKEELEEFHSDVKDNVAEPIFEVSEEIEGKAMEFESGDISEDELITYFEEDLQSVIDEKRDYLQDYPEPGTEEGQEYYAALTDGMNMTLDILEKTSELVVSMVDGDFDAMMTLGEEVDQMTGEMEEKGNRIEDLQEQYEEEFDAEFEEIEQF